MRNRKIVQTSFGGRTDHVMEIITDALASVTGVQCWVRLLALSQVF